MATKPEPTQARPTAGTYSYVAPTDGPQPPGAYWEPTGMPADTPVPHAGFDAMLNGGPAVTSTKGAPLNQPSGSG